MDIHALISSHPVLWTLASAAFGALGGKVALARLETSGVDWLVNKLSDLQESRLKAAGLTPEQIQVLAQHEAAAAQRAADDLKKRAEAISAAPAK